MKRTALKAKKTKKCAICKEPFLPFNSLIKHCSPDCGFKLARKNFTTECKKERKAWKEKNRTIAGWCLEARRDGFNPYIRLRDKDDGCIVCGSRIKASYHAGHFMSVGSRPELQFHPYNCHKQCSGCNCSMTSVAKKYRSNLVDKIGLEMVEYLENYHAVVKLTVDEIKEIKAFYRAELKRIKGDE